MFSYKTVPKHAVLNIGIQCQLILQCLHAMETDEGLIIAAASEAIWDNKAACGRKYRVRCIGATNQGVPKPCRGGSVVVKIVDLCPEGCQGTIDLSQEAFSKITDPNAGKI